MRGRVGGEIRAGHVPLSPSVIAVGIFLFSFNQSPQENCSRAGALSRAPGDAKSAKLPRKYLVQQSVCRGSLYSPRSYISHSCPSCILVLSCPSHSVCAGEALGGPGGVEGGSSSNWKNKK